MQKLKSSGFFLSLVFVSLASFAAAQNVIVNSDPTLNDRFSKKSGNIRFSSTHIRFNRIYNNEIKRDTIRMYNAGTIPITFETDKIPEYIKITLSPSKLDPKKEGYFIVSYDGSKKKDYGISLDRIDLITNDTAQLKKTITMTASIAEYFPEMTAEDSMNVQKARWEESVYDFGKIKAGEKIKHGFNLSNDGNRNLVIRKTKSGSEALKAIAVPDTIHPGETKVVTLEYNSFNRSGMESRKMYVYMNDPAKPESVLEFKGEVLKNDSIK